MLRLTLYFFLGIIAGCQPYTENANIQRQNRTSAAAYNVQLGLAYLKQKDMPRAKQKLLSALDLAPDSPEAHAAMAYFMEQSGDISKAKEFYQKALSLTPNNGAQLNNYGAFLCRQGEYRQAEHFFLRAIEDVHYLNTAGAYENAGLCVMQISDEKKAHEYFLKALQHDSRRRQALIELLKLEKKNNLQQAFVHVQQYKELIDHDASLNQLAKTIRIAYQNPQIGINNTDLTGAKNEHHINNG